MGSVNSHLKMRIFQQLSFKFELQHLFSSYRDVCHSN